MYLKFNEIKGLHLELTSKCNLQCLQCGRFNNGKLTPGLPLEEISISDIKNTYNQICSQLEDVHINGNFGDSIAAKCTLPALAYFRENSRAQIRFYTNGSGQDSDWWRLAANILCQKNDHVVFSIDGLENTNHIYRTKSSWQKIINSATAFISAGGKAIWEFIVFEHNFHQIEEVKLLAKNMGFKVLRLKTPARSKSVYKYDKNSSVVPASIQWPNGYDQVEEIINKEYHGDQLAFMNDAHVDCTYRKRKWIYVSFQHELWPCCWLASAKFKISDKNYELSVQKLFKKYGANFLSLRHNSIEAVLNHIWFKTALIDSWRNNLLDPVNPRLKFCASRCNTRCDTTTMSNQKTFILNS